jgi:hypothetical protein
MRDKSLNIWLIVLFGLSGMAILLLAWLLPTLQSERITATLVGSAGLLLASARALILKRSLVRTDDQTVPVKVAAEDNY